MHLSLQNKLAGIPESGLIFILSFIILWNLGFHILIYFPLAQSPDIQTYLGLSHLHFDESLVRQYRIIIPLLASLLHFFFGWFFDLFHPWTFEGDFSLCFSFLLVNTFIMALALTFIFKLCRSFQLSYVPCLFAWVAVLSSRWSAELSGLPLVDSLYFLSLVLTIYGLITGKNKWVFFSILIGPWAKESYLFMIPVILIFMPGNRLKTLGYIGLSGVLVFSFRFALDAYLGRSMMNSFYEDISSINSVELSLKRLMSFHGIYDLFGVIGFWILIPIFIWFTDWKLFIHKYKRVFPLFNAYLLIVLVQALLSSDLSRMFYLAIPVIAVWISISLNIFNLKYLLNAKGRSKE